jgi:hypothetical protein
LASNFTHRNYVAERGRDGEASLAWAVHAVAWPMDWSSAERPKRRRRRIDLK